MLLTDILGSKTTTLAPRSGFVGSVAGGAADATVEPARAMTSATARVRPSNKARGPRWFPAMLRAGLSSDGGGLMRSTSSPWSCDTSLEIRRRGQQAAAPTSAPPADTVD